MGLKLGTLTVLFNADTSNAERGQKRLVKGNKAVSSSFTALSRVISIALSLETARRFIMMADKVKLLDARIKGLTKSNKEFIQTQKGIRDIANSSGQALDEVLRLYQGIKIGADELGASNEKVLQITESFNQLAVIGGTTTEALKLSARQFSQAMAGGIVRAEEFNSIVENTPLVIRSIADGLGVSIGQMRNMVIEGRLLSKDVFDALLGQTEDIQKRFEDIPLTSARAWQKLQNEITIAVGKIDQAVEASSKMAESIDSAADNIVSFTDNIIIGSRAVDILFSKFDIGFLRALGKIDKMLGQFNLASRFLKDMGSETSTFGQRWILVTHTVEEFFLRLRRWDVVATLQLKRGVAGYNEAWERSFNFISGFFDKLGIRWDHVSNRMAEAGEKVPLKLQIAWEKLGNKINTVFGSDVDTSNLEELEKRLVDLNKKSLEGPEKALDVVNARVAAENAALQQFLTNVDKLIEAEKLRTQLMLANSEKRKQAIIDEIRSIVNEADDANLLEKLFGEFDKDFIDVPEAGEEIEKIDTDTLKPVSDIDEAAAKFGDETQSILNAHAERQAKINEITKAGTEERARLETLSAVKLGKDLAKQDINRIRAVRGVTDKLIQLGTDRNGKMNALGKAALAVSKGLALAEAAIAMQQNIAAASKVGFPQNIAMIAGAISQGISIISTLKSLGTSPGRVHGGLVSAGGMHPINENGDPEVLRQGARSFLLPGSKGGNVVSGRDMTMKSGGSPNITVVNNGPPVDVSGVTITRDEIMIEIEASQERTVSQIDNSLRTGRGSTAAALNDGNIIEKRID